MIFELDIGNQSILILNERSKAVEDNWFELNQNNDSPLFCINNSSLSSWIILFSGNWILRTFESYTIGILIFW